MELRKQVLELLIHTVMTSQNSVVRDEKIKRSWRGRTRGAREKGSRKRGQETIKFKKVINSLEVTES